MIEIEIDLRRFIIGSAHMVTEAKKSHDLPSAI